MERDISKEDLPLPSADEATVIRKILGRCVHGNTERTVVRRLIDSACLDCGETMSLGLESDDPVSPSEEARRWRASLPRPATHLIVADAALALVGRAGWHTFVRQDADGFVCTVSRGDRVAKSAAHKTRAGAIVDALAQMASEYRFVG